MAYPFTLHPLARREALLEIDFLEEQRTGYGNLFNEVLDQTLGLLLKHPTRYPKVSQDSTWRKMLMGKPFHKSHSIYFEFDGEIIRIISIFNNRRDPSIWINRQPED